MEDCPSCKADLRTSVNGVEYYRTIGMEVRGMYDGVLFWICPDCDHAWPRFVAPDFRAAKSQEFADKYMGSRNG